MFSKFLRRLQPTPTAAPERTPGFDPDKLRMLAMHFPIGRKMHYFPEYHRDAVLTTIILAYRINENFVYANDGVQLGEDRAKPGFRVDGGGWLALDDLKSFQILVPDTSEMERQLDYFTRAELGRAGQFKQGNIITLINKETAGRGIPTLDTTVYRRMDMREGPYVGSAAVLLTPDFATLGIADKRRHQRVSTARAAGIYLSEDAHTAFPCELRDFSEKSLRLAAVQAEAMPSFRQGQTLYVEFQMAETGLWYRFQGKMARQDNETCVVKIDQIYLNGEFKKVRLMDVLEIKTQLLNAHS